MLRISFWGMIAIMCVCCESPANDTSPNNQYYLALSFMDAAGNDLVMGIKGTRPDGSIEPDYVALDQYTLESSPDAYELGLVPRPGVVYDNPDFMEDLYLIEEPAGATISYYLTFDKSCPKDSDVKQITYTLTCPHVFGDEAAHQIVTYWREPSSGRSHYRVCYRVEVDGKEFTDITYASYEQLSFATIVLDR